MELNPSSRLQSTGDTVHVCARACVRVLIHMKLFFFVRPLNGSVKRPYVLVTIMPLMYFYKMTTNNHLLK